MMTKSKVSQSMPYSLTVTAMPALALRACYKITSSTTTRPIRCLEAGYADGQVELAKKLPGLQPY